MCIRDRGYGGHGPFGCGRVRLVRLGQVWRFRCGWSRCGFASSVTFWLGAAGRSRHGMFSSVSLGFGRAVKLKGVKLWLDLKRKIDRE